MEIVKKWTRCTHLIDQYNAFAVFRIWILTKWAAASLSCLLHIWRVTPSTVAVPPTSVTRHAAVDIAFRHPVQPAPT